MQNKKRPKKAIANSVVEVNKADFLQSINKLKPALLANSSFLPQGDCFTFSPTNIFSTNGQISMSAHIKTGVIGTVLAADLYKIVDKLEEGAIAFSQTDKEIRLAQGKLRAGLKLIIPDDVTTRSMPTMDESIRWKKVGDDLLNAIALARFSVSKDIAYPELVCVHCDGAQIISSDNLRITCISLEQTYPKFSLPGNAAGIIDGQPIRKIGQNDNWIFLSYDNITMAVCKVVTKQLALPENIFDLIGSKITLPKALVTVVERACIMCETIAGLDAAHIELQIANNKLISRAEKASGWIEEELPIAYNKAAAIKILINPTFLKQILAHTHTMVTDGSKAMFTAKNLKHILCLKD